MSKWEQLHTAPILIWKRIAVMHRQDRQLITEEISEKQLYRYRLFTVHNNFIKAEELD